MPSQEPICRIDVVVSCARCNQHTNHNNNKPQQKKSSLTMLTMHQSPPPPQQQQQQSTRQLRLLKLIISQNHHQPQRQRWCNCQPCSHKSKYHTCRCTTNNTIPGKLSCCSNIHMRTNTNNTYTINNNNNNLHTCQFIHQYHNCNPGQ